MTDIEDKDERKGFSWSAFWEAVGEFAFWTLIWDIIAS